LSVIATQRCGYGGGPASSVATHAIPSIVGLASLASFASLRIDASEPPLLDAVKLEASPEPLELPDPVEPLDEPLDAVESPVPPPPSSGVSADIDVAQPPASKIPTAPTHEHANKV
jgi:hypothetical protein